LIGYGSKGLGSLSLTKNGYAGARPYPRNNEVSRYENNTNSID